jgi:acetyltransferase-like isoleucine patch superfamily enzyme
MGYLTNEELALVGFKHLGRNVKISRLASIHRPEEISVGDNSRIDDFCAISGKITIGRNVHIAVHCSMVASEDELTLGDFSGLAFGCRLFTSSDDYSGRSLTNPTIPSQYKSIKNGAIMLGKHVIVGTNSVVFPGVDIAEGCSVGAMTLVTKSTLPWGIYAGNPAQRIKERSRDLLIHEENFLKTERSAISDLE